MVDKILSPHYTLYQLTQTNRAEFQERNRMLTLAEIGKLGLVANLLEECRQILSCELDIHSGYRCPELNTAVGSTDRSQHPKCEAVDFSPHGPDNEVTIKAAFGRIIHAATQGNFPRWGQLIAENQATRFGDRKFWLHISLGEPYREEKRLGQVLVTRDGVYTHLARV